MHPLSFSLTVLVVAVLTALCLGSNSKSTPTPIHVGGSNESRCKLKPDPGPCKGYFPKYFYNPTARVWPTLSPSASPSEFCCIANHKILLPNLNIFSTGVPAIHLWRMSWRRPLWHFEGMWAGYLWSVFSNSEKRPMLCTLYSILLQPEKTGKISHNGLEKNFRMFLHKDFNLFLLLSQTCDTFVWGGCRGKVPFNSLKECLRAFCQLD